LKELGRSYLTITKDLTRVMSAGGVADERVTQMLRQGDAQVSKKYSQMKLQMKREALEKLNRRASEMAPTTGERMRTVVVQ
jgi:predicted transcriptional regulator